MYRWYVIYEYFLILYLSLFFNKLFFVKRKMKNNPIFDKYKKIQMMG